MASNVREVTPSVLVTLRYIASLHRSVNLKGGGLPSAILTSTRLCTVAMLASTTEERLYEYNIAASQPLQDDPVTISGYGASLGESKTRKRDILRVFTMSNLLKI